ncbi:unnamed protein product, partial [Closterium sp. Naga37s-1]
YPFPARAYSPPLTRYPPRPLSTPTAASLRQAQRAPPFRRRAWRAAAAGGAGEADVGTALLATAADDGAVRAVSATRSGLFRSPVSGGVESATSAHRVGRAQYAQLCSIMPRSHHRRRGTPWDRSLTAPLTLPDIYFVGGCGTVAWIGVAEYVAATPDTVATNHAEHALQ